MAEQWYVQKTDGTISGPFLERDVSLDLLSGKIGDDQKVRQGSAGPWCDAARARSVFRQLADVGWYIRTQDEVFGPFTEAKLLELHRTGELDPAAEIRQGVAGNWKLAESTLSLWQQQKVPQAKSNDPAAVETSDSSESVDGGKWSIEPMRHIFVDLEVHYAPAVSSCERFEHLLLKHCDDEAMGDRLLVTRTNDQRVGYLNPENSQQVLSNAERGLSHVTLFHAVIENDSVQVAIVLCPPGSSSESCKDYIDQQFHQQFVPPTN